jgi:aspartyl-tRNA(Asn)/glutamyl-tRNA(Gln) amidotransferase subunit A
MKRTLSGLAIGLAKGEVTSLALVKLALQAAKESEYVFTEIFFEESLNAAKASDERRARGLPLSPFDGIPIAVKDLFDIKGSSTLAGSKTRLEVEPAEEDSEIVANVIGAGMIPLGKVNLVEFAFSGLGLNPHFGTPSPDFKHVKPRIPGGSSSGSAVAVQRGIVCCSLGTDTGGSVRVPAAFNGLVGFKSTPHRYPMGGIFPLAPSLDSPGPITTTVEDCVLLDQVMRGETIGLPDPVSLSWKLS